MQADAGENGALDLDTMCLLINILAYVHIWLKAILFCEVLKSQF